MDLLTPYSIFAPFEIGQVAASPPPDLAAAIVARFEAAAGGALADVTKIYHTQAGDRATTPYLVFTVVAGRPILTTDVHYIFDQRVRFTLYADAQDRANDLRDLAVAPTFGAGSYDYRDGYSIPFFQVDQSEGKEPDRRKNGGYLFKAVLDYSARCHRDRR